MEMSGMQVIYLIILNHDLFGEELLREKSLIYCRIIYVLITFVLVQNNYEKYVILIPVYNDRESLVKLVDHINSELKRINL